MTEAESIAFIVGAAVGSFATMLAYFVMWKVDERRRRRGRK